MLKKIGLYSFAAIIILTTGCQVFVVETPKTYIKARNDLYGLRVNNKDVDDVDLYGVTIGDLKFSLIPSNETTSSYRTESEGVVDVLIDSAKAYSPTVIWVLLDLDPMETTISPEVTNTIVFNETTAPTIFAGLAKKLNK